MQREAPDKQFFAEVQELNREFLGLLVQSPACCRNPVFGLDPAVTEQIRRLAGERLDAIAATPCLLAEFRADRPGAKALRVAEPPPAFEPAWGAKARLFAAALLGYSWQMSRRDPLRASLCAGGPAGGLSGQMSFRQMRAVAEQSLQHLEARFCRHARFWPDLVSAARDGHGGRLDLARLTAIQLASAEVARRERYGPVPAAGPGLAASR